MNYSENKYKNSLDAVKNKSFNQNYIEDVEVCIGLKSVIEELELFFDVEELKLLCGKTGVGKEYFAHYIHAKSNRANGSFVAINMACFSENLLLSELCGHERGAFSGASSKEIGLFQHAENGTIFLDEFNSISHVNQGKILRIIEERKVTPVGGLNPIKINCRIIIGVNENLSDMVKAKTLREDLYYRINALEFIIPTLKERRQDIPILAKRIVSKIAKEKGAITPVITNEAMMLLLVQKWYGNVRELYNILYNIVYNCHDELITAKLVRDIFKRKNIPLLTYKEALVNFEKEIIEATLLSTPSISESAKLLGIGRTTLRDKMKRLGINEK